MPNSSQPVIQPLGRKLRRARNEVRQYERVCAKRRPTENETLRYRNAMARLVANALTKDV